MEEQIKKAKSTISWTGLGCKIFSVIGIIGTLIYMTALSSKEFKKNIFFWSTLGTAIGSSISIGALGSIAESSKKNQALTALLVESTNSASQLPFAKEIEYSDLNEDN